MKLEESLWLHWEEQHPQRWSYKPNSKASFCPLEAKRKKIYLLIFPLFEMELNYPVGPTDPEHVNFDKLKVFALIRCRGQAGLAAKENR